MRYLEYRVFYPKYCFMDIEVESLYDLYRILGNMTINEPLDNLKIIKK
jgi:hypothetical protein